MSQVKQELLKGVTKDTALIQCLEYAPSVKGNLQSVELSKYVEKAQPSTSITDVHADNKKKVKSKLRCHDVTPARQKTGDCESESSRCDKCGLKHKPKECPAFGKQCYRCGKDNHYARLVIKLPRRWMKLSTKVRMICSLIQLMLPFGTIKCASSHYCTGIVLAMVQPALVYMFVLALVL